MNERPIGVFDSGLGGLTVLQALVDLLPGEDLIYVGDTARYPYGDKSVAQLKHTSTVIARHLEAEGAKMIVVACNSATAAALPRLREVADVPVIGVVEPGLRAAATATRTGRAVVICTQVTAASRVYETAAHRMSLELTVTSLACPGLVELVEEGRSEGPEAVVAVRDRLAPLLSARVDTLILGCTHFPLLARAISEVVGRQVTLVSSADETAFEVRDLLERTGWLRERAEGGSCRLLTTGDPERFRLLGQRFLGWPLAEVRGHHYPELDRDPSDPVAAATAPWDADV